MNKSSKEQPQTNTSRAFEIETKISKEERLDPDKFPIEEWEALLDTLRLLMKGRKGDPENGGTLEIKKNPVTGEESAIVYRNSDHAQVFMTKDGLQIFYLKNPDKILEQIEINEKEKHAADKLIRHIQNSEAGIDKES